MGVDTRGIIAKRIQYEDIVQFIRKNYADVDVSYSKVSIDEIETFLFCKFKDGKDDRELIIMNNVTVPDSIEDRHEEIEYEDSVYTSISFRHRGNSVLIITNILKQFGGYIDENDCDDEGYYKIERHPQV